MEKAKYMSPSILLLWGGNPGGDPTWSKGFGGGGAKRASEFEFEDIEETKWEDL